MDVDVGAVTWADVDVETMGVGAGTDAGDRAYSSVHLRAVRSCCTRFRTYSVAIEGTVRTKRSRFRNIDMNRMMRELTKRIV